MIAGLINAVRGDLRTFNAEAAARWIQPDRAADRRLFIAVLVGALVLLAQNYLVLRLDGLPRLILVLGLEEQGRALYAAMTRGPEAMLLSRVFWALGIVVCLLIFPAIALKLSGGALTDHGWRLDSWRPAWIYLALLAAMLPIVTLAALQPGFRDYYPLYRPQFGEGFWTRLLLWEAIYVLQFVAVEFFFRGYLLHAAKHRFGAWAILLPLIPYVMVHFGKPPAEAAASIVAGLVLGYLSLRTGSIAYGIALHAGVALAMDGAALAFEPLP